MAETYYTVEQIASMLDIHPKTIQRYIREGKLRAVKLGKSWRVTGHDLSAFTESGAATASAAAASGGERAALSATASAVVDIDVPHRDEAIRIMNTLTAVQNAKPPEYGRSSLHVQYIEAENKVRVSLWGGVPFMAAMLDSVAMLTGQNE
jgi:excisionase family DNA binding protein